jgi:hypothetical protein
MPHEACFAGSSLQSPLLSFRGERSKADLTEMVYALAERGNSALLLSRDPVGQQALLMLQCAVQKALQSHNRLVGFRLNPRTQKKPVEYREPQRRRTIRELALEARSVRGRCQ